MKVVTLEFLIQIYSINANMWFFSTDRIILLLGFTLNSLLVARINYIHKKKRPRFRRRLLYKP